MKNGDLTDKTGFTDDREFAPFEDFVRREGLRVEAILVTHGHYDHIYGVSRCLDLLGDIPVYMHPDDVELIGMAEDMAAPYGGCPALAFDTVDVVDGQVLDLLGRQWTVDVRGPDPDHRRHAEAERRPLPGEQPH